MKQININSFFEENCKKGIRQSAGSGSVYMGIFSGGMLHIRIDYFNVRSHLHDYARRLSWEMRNEAS